MFAMAKGSALLWGVQALPRKLRWQLSRVAVFGKGRDPRHHFVTCSLSGAADIGPGLFSVNISGGMW